MLIALDGAANWLLDHGITPDLVIGDLDSYETCDDILLKQLHVTDQDSNDLAKAFIYCEENGLNDLLVVGGFGLRVDHFLTNLFALKKFAPRLSITFADEKQIAFICPNQQRLSVQLSPGAFISLFPLGDKVGPIWTSGVDFPLRGEMLSLESRIGTLNRIEGEGATVLCENGALLLIAPNQLSL